MADEVKELVTKLGTTFEEFKKVNDERLQQIEQKGHADPLLEQKVDKMSNAITEFDQVKERLDKAETALARKSAFTSEDNSKMEQKAADFMKMAAANRGMQPSEFTVDDMKSYKKSFGEFMRKGDMMSPDAQKALSAGIDPDGGYLVEPDTSGRIVSKVFETSPMRQVASVQTIGTDALEGLYDLDEAGAGWVGETDSRATTSTPQFAKWRIPVHEIYANPAATQRILDDSMVDLEMWLANKVADKFARTENAAFVTGDGVGKPRGFLTYPTGTSLPGTIEQIKTGVNGAFAADGTGADTLISTVYALKAFYRGNGRWFMPKSLMSTVRKLKNASGDYLWQPSLQAGVPSTLAGYPVVEMEDMPEAATGSLSIAFGDMASAYQIVDRQGVRVLRDPYTNKPYVHFYTTKRTGGDVIDFDALKIIDFSA